MIQSGKIIYQLRLNKKLTQTQLAFGIISPSFLSRYERGETQISDANLFALLERLNTSFSEFEQLYQIYLDNETQVEFFKNLKSLVIQKDIQRLEQLFNTEGFLFRKGNIRHLHQQKLIGLYLRWFKTGEISKEDCKFFSYYLFSVDEWGLYEIRLFEQLINFLNLDDFQCIIRTIRHKRFLFENDYFFTQQYSTILLKIFIKLICHGKINESFELKSTLKELLKHHPLSPEICKFKFYANLLTIASGSIQQGTLECERIISALKVLGSDKLAKEFNILLSKVISKFSKDITMHTKNLS
ncbi:MAG: helix-turn-helix domain-containing protein [Streptococcus sp.]|jgi:transcriptional activator, rgg/gadR/mutR family, C-terminal domain|nr:helix-turn-helix domain-containing protein [Streptococcus sp.]